MATDSTISNLPTASVLLGSEYLVLDQNGTTSKISAAQLLSRGVLQVVSYAATLSWDVTLGNIATVTLTGNTTLALPNNLQPGSYVLLVNQDSTGGRTMGFATGYKWPGGFPPVLSTATNALDILSFVSDGITMYGSAQKAFG